MMELFEETSVTPLERPWLNMERIAVRRPANSSAMIRPGHEGSIGSTQLLCLHCLCRWLENPQAVEEGVEIDARFYC